MTDYQDKNITCRECGSDFVWTAGEQDFYAQKGFENAPTRCQDCRKKRKESVQHEITCKKCGEKGTVPFEPRDPSDVLCGKCYAESKEQG